jgi:transcriptional regulator with XRE-family HTH domain
MKINHTISMKIKNARESQGFSQRDLSVKAGLSASYIGAVEARRINPSINALNKIAAALPSKEIFCKLFGKGKEGTCGDTEKWSYHPCFGELRGL